MSLRKDSKLDTCDVVPVHDKKQVDFQKMYTGTKILSFYFGDHTITEAVWQGMTPEALIERLEFLIEQIEDALGDDGEGIGA